MNINNPTSFSTPDLTLSTSNSSGVAGALRADDTLLVYDTTLPDPITYGQSGSVGSAATSARRDHAHAMAASDAVAQASQAETEDESNVDKYVPPDLINFSPGVSKGMVYVVNDGTHTAASAVNITSTAKSSTGIYLITWASDFGSSNYIMLTSVDAGDTRVANVRNMAAGTVNVNVYDSNSASTLEDSNFMVAAWGAQ